MTPGILGVFMGLAIDSGGDAHFEEADVLRSSDRISRDLGGLTEMHIYCMARILSFQFQLFLHLKTVSLIPAERSGFLRILPDLIRSYRARSYSLPP